jgi:hypothetical protein
MRKRMTAIFLITASALVMAKLPAPSGEAIAKADEAAAKAAWSGKVDAYLSCKSQDKVAAHYFKTARAAHQEPKPATQTPSCADPGVFTYTPPEAAKPLEASGAHSPAPTATSPPSSKSPAAAIAPAK